MITKNPMQLKALIKNKAKKMGTPAQLVMQYYMFERLIERISLSPYRNNFIFKGGFLLSAYLGLDKRTTMDLDTTITGFPLTHEKLTEIFTEICSIPVEDDVTFEIVRTTDIREGAVYPGIRLYLQANYPPISVPLTMDVTTGDVITPRAIEFPFPLLFEDKSISLLSYNLETVLSEKLHSVLSRGAANTRPRDFYDLYVIHSFHHDEIDYSTLKLALRNTFHERMEEDALEFDVIGNYESVLNEILKSKEMLEGWKRYQKRTGYAEGISFIETCEAIRGIMREISE